MLKEITDQLYYNLLSLCDGVDYYYKDDVTINGTQVRVFTYRFGQYTKWVKPSALECRGIMFEMKDGKPVRIMSRPPEKFFNLYENPFTADACYEDIEYLMTKEDGSLVSSYIDGGQSKLKSKTSVKSDVAISANALLENVNFLDLRDRIKELAEKNYTCNLEYVSPSNQIVLGYNEPNLVLLSVRHNYSGKYISYQELVKDPVLRKYLVKAFGAPKVKYAEVDDFVSYVRGLKGIEGYVIKTPNLTYKLKTDWYCSIHHVKFNLTSNKALFECVYKGGTDDIRLVHSGDPFMLEKIEAFEKAFHDGMTLMYNTCYELRNKYKHLDRRSYAIKTKSGLCALNLFELHGAVMNMFLGDDPDRVIYELQLLFEKNFRKYVPEKYKNA